MPEIEEINQKTKDGAVDEPKKDIGPELSYQWLIEKKMDLNLSPNDGSGHVNISSLLRDLYNKIYALETLVKSLPINK